MKLRVSLITGIIITLFIAVGYLIFSEKSANDIVFTAVEPPKEKIDEKAVSKINVKSHQLEEDSAEIQARIQALTEQAEQSYLDIVNLSGAYEERPLNYEDNWCIPNEDLSKEDRMYALRQKNEWRFNRGYITTLESLKPFIKEPELENAEMLGINEEYHAYEDKDKATLMRLGSENNDVLALNTLLRLSSKKYKLSRKEEAKIAEQLVVLGDTSVGLSSLIIDNAVYANHVAETGKENPVPYIKKALTLVIYGGLRQDISKMRLFLRIVSRQEQEVAGLNMLQSFSDNDFVEIEKEARLYYQYINQKRLEKGLPNLEDIDDPKIAEVNNAGNLWHLYNNFNDILTGSIFPSSWKNTYLHKTPCAERKIARDHFLYTDLPAIKKEIAKLEQRLNN